MSGTRRRAGENSGRTAGRFGPGNPHAFKPGSSGNPGGRPKGLASAVKERVDPVEIVEGLLDVARDPRAKASERIAAWRELGDRGWGKAPAFAAIEGSDPLELDVIAQEIQGIADELRARRDARTEKPSVEGSSVPGTATG